MRINEKYLQSFGAKLLAFSVAPAISVSTYKPSDSTSFVRLRRTIGLKSIEVQIDFTGNNRHEIARSHSEFLAETTKEGLTLILPDGYTYRCELDSATPPAYQAYFIATSTFTFSGIQHGQAVHITPPDGRFFCESTMPETDCVLSVQVSRAATRYVFAGITFTNARVGETFTLDGITKRVLVNGAPGLLRSNIVRFPTLVPGWNTITAPDPITVEYAPTFL